MIASIEESGLLDGEPPRVVRPDGRAATIHGVRIVDPQRFAALPDETFLSWRQNDWLAPIYAHLSSQTNWDGLAAPV